MSKNKEMVKAIEAAGFKEMRVASSNFKAWRRDVFRVVKGNNYWQLAACGVTLVLVFWDGGETDEAFFERFANFETNEFGNARDLTHIVWPPKPTLSLIDRLKEKGWGDLWETPSCGGLYSVLRLGRYSMEYRPGNRSSDGYAATVGLYEECMDDDRQNRFVSSLALVKLDEHIPFEDALAKLMSEPVVLSTVEKLCLGG